MTDFDVLCRVHDASLHPACDAAGQQVLSGRAALRLLHFGHGGRKGGRARRRVVEGEAVVTCVEMAAASRGAVRGEHGQQVGEEEMRSAALCADSSARGCVEQCSESAHLPPSLALAVMGRGGGDSGERSGAGQSGA